MPSITSKNGLFDDIIKQMKEGVLRGVAAPSQWRKDKEIPEKDDAADALKYHNEWMEAHQKKRECVLRELEFARFSQMAAIEQKRQSLELDAQTKAQQWQQQWERQRQIMSRQPPPVSSNQWPPTWSQQPPQPGTIRTAAAGFGGRTATGFMWIDDLSDISDSGEIKGHEKLNPTLVEFDKTITLDGHEKEILTGYLNAGWRVVKIDQDLATFSTVVYLKQPDIRSRKMLNGAEGQSCVNCGKNDGTTVACHYQGIRGDDFGRGGSKKAYDLIIADLCSKCHAEFDNYEGSFVKDPLQRKVDLSERFMYCVMMTLIRRVRQGILKADDLKLLDV